LLIKGGRGLPHRFTFVSCPEAASLSDAFEVVREGGAGGF
jgi:hypothetical protein